MFVLFYAHNVANTLMVNVNVIPAGKVKSVRYDMMSVRYPIVMDMDIVLAESVNVLAATKANSVKKVRITHFLSQ